MRARLTRIGLPGWGPYVAAGAAYVTLGVLNTRLLLSWVEGIGFLLLCVWVIPALLRRRR